jgi:hypothetical protein
MKTGTGALLINYGRSKSTQTNREENGLDSSKMKITKQGHVMREKMKGRAGRNDGGKRNATHTLLQRRELAKDQHI